MRIFMCYRFSDGYRAYFFKDDPEHHIVLRPDEHIRIEGLKFERTRFKELKSDYPTWLKRLKKETTEVPSGASPVYDERGMPHKPEEETTKQ